MTLVVVLVVTLGALIGIAGLRLAQMRSVPLAGAREAPQSGAGAPSLEVSADAWADPSSDQVVGVLDRYFSAISAHNYAAWASTVTPAKAAELSQADWAKQYRSTQIGTIRLSRIDQVGAGQQVAMVSFVSTQNPADAPSPDHLAQLCWRETLPLTGSPPRIDSSKAGDVLRGACH